MTANLIHVGGKPFTVDLSKAHPGVIASNHFEDPSYVPYCGRCNRLVRMRLVEPFLWRHDCGAIHDERQVLVPFTSSAGSSMDHGGGPFDKDGNEGPNALAPSAGLNHD